MNEVKDSIANTVTFTGLGLSLMEIESILTVGILITALYLNLQRIWDNHKKKQD